MMYMNYSFNGFPVHWRLFIFQSARICTSLPLMVRVYFQPRTYSMLDLLVPLP